MSKPTGHYIAVERSITMVLWYANGTFYKAGSATPYTANCFDKIATEPMVLTSDNTVKGTTW